jgi:hypothetical protein
MQQHCSSLFERARLEEMLQENSSRHIAISGTLFPAAGSYVILGFPDPSGTAPSSLDISSNSKSILTGRWVFSLRTGLV